MDRKITGIVAYITWVGLLVAYFAGDKEGAKFHINQALVIWLAELVNIFVGFIPVIGGILSGIIGLFLFVCFLIGLIGACQDQEKEIPLIGQIKILQ